MEWLDFNGWSPEVAQALSRQRARAREAARKARPHGTLTASALCALLAGMPRSNPWGHPPSEC